MTQLQIAANSDIRSVNFAEYYAIEPAPEPFTCTEFALLKEFSPECHALKIIDGNSISTSCKDRKQTIFIPWFRGGIECKYEQSKKWIV